MNVQEFAQKLEELCKKAENHDHRLEVRDIRSAFEGMDLEQDQLLKVLQYLKRKGIEIVGINLTEEAVQKEEKQLVPLTPEEQAYLEEYKAEIAEGTTGLMAEYLPLAMELAVEMNCEEMHIADLIQEANLCLLMLLKDGEKLTKEEVRNEMKNGLIAAIEEQTQRKIGDEQLVEKVQKLEDAIRDLSEDEDEEPDFGIGELAVLLDMEVEEIKNILRLTGEEE